MAEAAAYKADGTNKVSRMPVTTLSKSVLFIEYSFLFVSSRPEVPRTEVERSVFQSESLADPSTPLGMTDETLGMTGETLGMTGRSYDTP